MNKLETIKKPNRVNISFKVDYSAFHKAPPATEKQRIGMNRDPVQKGWKKYVRGQTRYYRILTSRGNEQTHGKVESCLLKKRNYSLSFSYSYSFMSADHYHHHLDILLSVMLKACI